jgi:hypothetical protein
MTHAARRFAALLALPLAACGENGFAEDPLTPSEVQGSYSVCLLRFRPENPILPVADVLDAVMDSTPPTGLPMPSVAVSGTAYHYQLRYAREQDAFLRLLEGNLGMGETTVTARFYENNDPGAVASELLLPGSLTFTFSDAPRRLTDTTTIYTVRRADYAAAAGVPETDLQDRVSGRLEASLRVGGCS